MGRVRGKTRSSSGDSGGQNIGPPPPGKIGPEKHGMQKFSKLFLGVGEYALDRSRPYLETLAWCWVVGWLLRGSASERKVRAP